MQLTRAADYAVRVMIHLASQPEGTVVSKSVLADASGAPESFLSKILQAMARAGLIQARRGVEGGFFLQERGAQASLLDVVESIDGPVAVNVCLNTGIFCERIHECPAHNVWQRAQQAMVEVLREATIAEMAAATAPRKQFFQITKTSAGGRKDPKPPARQASVTAWAKRRTTSRPSPAAAGRISRKKKQK